MSLKRPLQCPHSDQSRHPARGQRPAYPDDDPHPLALRREGEGLQDAVGQDLAAGGPQLHGREVSVDQSEADALRPLHQGHLRETSET